MKETAIEEAAANLADPNVCKTDNWIAGAKWMQEQMTNKERFLELVSDEETNTIERAKQRIAKRQAMKIDQEEFNRKAQHILDTVVKPQVARYEKAKAEGKLIPKPRQVGAAGWVADEYLHTIKEQVKPRGTLRRLTEEMKKDPWHVKLRRWWRFQRWVWMCRTRWIWDLQYEHNIFRKKQ
jgi:hypothetical protein